MNGEEAANGQNREVKLQSMPWYHGMITREMAEAILNPREDGLFLIRESVNFPGDFTMCLCSSEGNVEHYRIIYNPSQRKCYTIDEEVYFANLSDLVNHYSRDADGLVSRLIKALPKAGQPVFPPVLHYFHQQGWVLPRERLELEERLGSGDFAEVFKAKFDGQVMAAKCVQQDSKISFIGMKEAAVMTALKHPNLVRLFGLVMDSDQIYLLTEFMQHGSLINYLRTRGKADITTGMQLCFAVDITSGMSHLESKGLVHRDLAARNVLLDSNLTAKVADFGLCREVDSRECSGKVPIKWTAPEAVRRNLFTPSSDMWSFGVLLWEIYSFGRLPYLGISVGNVLEKIESGYRLQPPSDTPPYALDIMQKAWSLQVDKRPTFKEVHSHLTHLKKQLVVNPPILSASSSTRPNNEERQRHRQSLPAAPVANHHASSYSQHRDRLV